MARFEGLMGKRTTAHLLSLLRERHTYVPDAVSAAMTELRKREVNGFEISNALDEGDESAALDMALASEPLPRKWQIFWMLLPFLALTPIGTRYFCRLADAGLRRKSVQYLEAVTIGAMGYLIVFMLVMLWW